MITTQKALLKMWSKVADLDDNVDLDKPLMYMDRFRMRNPGDSKFRLKPHLDGGTFQRWTDPIYRYLKISGIKTAAQKF